MSESDRTDSTGTLPGPDDDAAASRHGQEAEHARQGYGDVPARSNRLYHEDDVGLLDVMRARQRPLLHAGLVIAVLAIAAGFVVRIDWTVDVPFRLRALEGGRQARVFDNLHLETWHTSTGDTVAAGDPVVTVRSAMISDLLGALRAARSARERFDEFTAPARRQELEFLRRRRALAEEAVASAEAQRERLEEVRDAEIERAVAMVDNARRRVDREKRLLELGSGSEQRVEDAQTDLAVAEADHRIALESRVRDLAASDDRVSSARRTLLQLDETIGELESSLDDRAEELAFAEKEALDAIAQRYGRTRPLVEEDALVLLSPMDGRVTYVQRERDQAPSGTLLYAVQAPDADFRAVLGIPAHQIALVKRAADDAVDPVQLKFTAYPHYEYGLMEAGVEEISGTVDETGRYPARLEPYGGTNRDIELVEGLTGTATFTVEQRSLFGYLFKNIADAFASDEPASPPSGDGAGGR